MTTQISSEALAPALLKDLIYRSQRIYSKYTGLDEESGLMQSILLSRSIKYLLQPPENRFIIAAPKILDANIFTQAGRFDFQLENEPMKSALFLFFNPSALVVEESRAYLAPSNLQSTSAQLIEALGIRRQLPKVVKDSIGKLNLDLIALARQPILPPKLSPINVIEYQQLQEQGFL